MREGLMSFRSYSWIFLDYAYALLDSNKVTPIVTLTTFRISCNNHYFLSFLKLPAFADSHQNDAVKEMAIFRLQTPTVGYRKAGLVRSRPKHTLIVFSITHTPAVSNHFERSRLTSIQLAVEGER